MEENASGGNGRGEGAEDGSYRLLMRGEDFRVGVSKERPEEGPLVTSIELLVRLFRTGMRIGPEDMGRALELVKKLAESGYSIYFQEDGWILCEKQVGDAESGPEARRLQGLLGGR